MIIRISRLILITFIILSTYLGSSQTYFSKRLNVGGLVNLATSFEFYKDTFYIPSFVIETNTYYSVSLLKVSNTGSIITQKRFHPNNVNFTGGNDLYIRNNKFYVPSVTDFNLKLQTGLYVFNNGCDTLFSKAYGDTVYYNLGFRIQPYKKDKDKLLIFGMTDSTCGSNHPGLYKPIIRIVDTNGVLSQTKLYLSTNKYRNLHSVDTTTNKGYIFCGGEFQSAGNVNNFIIKLDSNLNMTWLKYLDTTESNCGIVSSKRGGYYFATTHLDSNYMNFAFWERPAISRLDDNGNVKWKKFYGTKQQGIGVTNIKELKNGDILVCGLRETLYSTSVGQLVGFLMRTDSSGNLKWWNNYIPTSPIKDTAGDCYLYDIMEMPDKGFAAVGWVGGNGGLGTIQQSWLLRTDSMGCLVSSCAALSGIEEINNEINFSVYPNPTNGKIIIEFSDFEDDINLRITDIPGKDLYRTIIIEKRTELDLNIFDNGIYFLHFYKDNRIFSVKKIIKEQ